MKGGSSELRGKVALVTGAGRRIGAAIARRLHGEGMNVVLHYRSSAADAGALRDELEAVRADSADLAEADLLDVAAIDALARAAAKRWGRLDALVNNASAFYPTPVGTITEAQWDDLVGSNLKAPVFLSQAVAPALAAHGGSIVNIVDIHAERPLSDHPVYSITKAGLLMATRALARELAPEIRVNGVSPGAILWPEDGLDEAGRERIIGRIALKRQGEPGDIARAVLFLLRDAPYVTGQVIAVDGGRSLHG